MQYNYSPSTRCAACKCLRRKCLPDCILASHFPSSNPQIFASVHKVFGAANITKMLEQVPVHLRGQAADSMIFEAAMRMRDLVYGSVGVISQLQQQINEVQKEILKIQGEIAIQHAQKHQVETIMQQQQLGGDDQSYRGLETVSDFALGLEGVNAPSGGEEVVSNTSQRYDLDLEEMYATFSH